MLSHRLRAAVAAALTVAGLTLPATVLTAPAHALPVRCATERTAVTDANQAATTARGNLADAKRALADAVAARRANPNTETRKGYTDALAARIAARGALNNAVEAVKLAVADRNACVNPRTPILTAHGGRIDDADYHGWALNPVTMTGLYPFQSYQWTFSYVLRNSGQTALVQSHVNLRADATGAATLDPEFKTDCNPGFYGTFNALQVAVVDNVGTPVSGVRIPMCQDPIFIP